MINPSDLIGTEDICIECGETKLIVALDWDDLPLCFECATKDMPKERGEKDGMPLQTRSAQQRNGADSEHSRVCPLCGRDPAHHDMYCDNHPHYANTTRS